MLFDQNCPEYFAQNERQDYVSFLNSNPSHYCLCTNNDKVVGVFGVLKTDDTQSRLEWIMLAPDVQGLGIGTKIMKKSIQLAVQQNSTILQIATSHVAYKFFKKFGAKVILETKNGWGPNMHRIDMELSI